MLSGSGRILKIAIRYIPSSYLIVCFLCEQEHEARRPSVIAETDTEAAEADTPLDPADDDLALRAALYGLVIQSYVDKVCIVI